MGNRNISFPLSDPQGYSSAQYIAAGLTPLPLGETGGYLTTGRLVRPG
jgi:hypothetical protein